MAFVLSVVTIAIAVASVHVSAWWFSPGVMILPILAGGLLLWPRALRIFFGFAAVAVIYDVAEGKAGAGIVATIVLTAAFADVLARTREKLGVQGLRGDRMLLELRDRIRAQGKLPELGEGWGSSLVLKPAGGSSFGGDFVVSFSDGKMLEVALVDVSGKGIDAEPGRCCSPARSAACSARCPGTIPSRLQRLHAPRQNQRGLRHRRAPVARPGHGGVRGDLGRAPACRALRRGVRQLAAHPRPRDRPRRRGRPDGAAPRPSGACFGAATRSCSIPTGWSKRPAGTSTSAPTGCSARRNAAGQRVPRRCCRSGRGHATGDRRLRRLRPRPPLAHLTSGNPLISPVPSSQRDTRPMRFPAS